MSNLEIIITDTDDYIQKEVNRILASEINKAVRENQAKVLRRFKNSLAVWLNNTPEIANLVARGPNTLNAQFGLVPGTAAIAVSDIVKAIQNSVVTNFVKFEPNSLRGSFQFAVQPTDFRNLLNLPMGTVISEKGEPIDWLRWLLTEGDSVIIYGWSYSPGAKGRSGGGNMVEVGNWSIINPRYTGTIADNFVTRALIDRESEMTLLLEGLLD